MLGRSPRRLRPWVLDGGHVEALVAAWNDPDISRFNRVPPTPTHDRARRWIEGDASRVDCIDLVVEVDGAIAGEVSAASIDRNRGTAVVAWWLLDWARGRGVGTWAVRAFGDWLLGDGGLERLAAVVGADNHGSAALAERAGFVERAATPDGDRVFERRAARVPPEP